MNAIKALSTSQWFRWKEAVVITLVGWVPLSLGRSLRRLLYRSIFAQFGNAVQIKSGVELIHTSSIAIGNKVKIDRGVALRNEGQNSRIKLGNSVKLDLGVIIKTHSDSEIEIGDCTYIGPYTCLSGKYIKIGRDCRIASHLGIYANNHIFTDPNRKIKEQGSTYKGIVIEDDCWLASGVRIVDGVTVGQGSVIGAGAVVTKDVPPYSVAVGVPAKVIKSRTPGEQIILNIPEDTVTDDNRLSVSLSRILAEVEKTSQQKFQYPLPKGSAIAGLTPHNLLYQLLECTGRAINVTTVTVLLRTEDRQHLEVRASVGLEDEIAAGIKIPFGRGFAGRVAVDCQPMIVEDISTIEIFSPILRNKGLRSILGVPLQINGQVVGVFHVGTTLPRQFTSDEIKFMQLIAECIALFVVRAEITLVNVSQAPEEFGWLYNLTRSLNSLWQFLVNEFAARQTKSTRVDLLSMKL
ncbi:GAF domain-containing protein [Gloeocapsa sp. BRSZ]